MSSFALLNLQDCYDFAKQNGQGKEVEGIHYPKASDCDQLLKEVQDVSEAVWGNWG